MLSWIKVLVYLSNSRDNRHKCLFVINCNQPIILKKETMVHTPEIVENPAIRQNICFYYKLICTKNASFSRWGGGCHLLPHHTTAPLLVNTPILPSNKHPLVPYANSRDRSERVLSSTALMLCISNIPARMQEKLLRFSHACSFSNA